jgi:hypothetical protein
VADFNTARREIDRVCLRILLPSLDGGRHCVRPVLILTITSHG